MAQPVHPQHVLCSLARTRCRDNHVPRAPSPDPKLATIISITPLLVGLVMVILLGAVASYNLATTTATTCSDISMQPLHGFLDLFQAFDNYPMFLLFQDLGVVGLSAITTAFVVCIADTSRCENPKLKNLAASSFIAFIWFLLVAVAGFGLQILDRFGESSLGLRILRSGKCTYEQSIVGLIQWYLVAVAAATVLAFDLVALHLRTRWKLELIDEQKGIWALREIEDAERDRAGVVFDSNESLSDKPGEC